MSVTFGMLHALLDSESYSIYSACCSSSDSYLDLYAYVRHGSSVFRRSVVLSLSAEDDHVHTHQVDRYRRLCPPVLLYDPGPLQYVRLILDSIVCTHVVQGVACACTCTLRELCTRL